jgi:hypothetical protein
VNIEEIENLIHQLILTCSRTQINQTVAVHNNIIAADGDKKVIYIYAIFLFLNFIIYILSHSLFY